MPNVLIIDDDPWINDLLTRVVKNMGHDATCAVTLQEGLKEALSGAHDVVFLDIRLPDGDGLEALPKIQEAASAPEVIIITGYADPDGAELAIKSGAWDYIMKPFSMERMTLTLIRALEYRKKKAKQIPVTLKRDGIVGNSPKLNAVRQRVALAGASMANVLIVGETGTGKELFARAIHQNSPRALKRFVVVDCTAIPESLVESILFGHKRGVFTGADKTKDGLIKQADGGTLFLDEVGELPLSTQKSFLRVIQEHRLRPVGGKDEIGVDFRLISATNRDLDEMVRHGRFRGDLLFRLHALNIELPPLRERTGDIKDLAMYYTNKLCQIYSVERKEFSPEFFEHLSVYECPGNVRELFNTLEEVLSIAQNEPTLFPHHLPSHIRAKIARTSVNAAVGHKDDSTPLRLLEDIDRETFPKINDFRNDMERQYLEKLMSVASDSKKEACLLSGLSRTRLFELLKKHGISTI